MKLIYKGAKHRSDLEFIKYGVIKVGEAFIKDKEYEVPDELAKQIIEESSGVWVKSYTVEDEKEDEGDI